MINPQSDPQKVKTIQADDYSAAVLAKLIDCQDVPINNLPGALLEVAQKIKSCPNKRDVRAKAFTEAIAGLNGAMRPMSESVFRIDPHDPLPEPPEVKKPGESLESGAIDPLDDWPGPDLTEAGTDSDGHYSLAVVIKAYNAAESGDANLLAALGANQAVYDHASKAWYLWSGNHWERDPNRAMYRMVTNRLAPIYLDAAAEAMRADKTELSKTLLKRAAELQTKKRIENVIFLAATKENMSLNGDEWDHNPHLLGVNNGVVNLQDGSFRPGKPDDYILAYAPTDWKGLETPADQWEKFLSDVFSKDSAMCGFVQKLLGYGLSGKKTERVLPILWGEGANGKSTLLEVIGGILGSKLATSSQADAIMDTQKGGDGPRPFIYALKGKRLVWASESNEGRRINAGLVKQLTGNDRLNVRTLHTNPVEFTPSHLLMLITNHKPHISADDQAIWDRLILIPFVNRFVDNPSGANEYKRDRDLQEKLQAESPGILAWLVRGYLAWQKEGLTPPAQVKAATESYRESEDTLGQFISDCCLESDKAEVKAGELYEAYKKWCDTNNVSPLSGRSFGDRMTKRFDKKRVVNTNVYFGIGLLES